MSTGVLVTLIICLTMLVMFGTAVVQGRRLEREKIRAWEKMVGRVLGLGKVTDADLQRLLDEEQRKGRN